MSFYSNFAEYYEAVFPFREEVYTFLRARMPEPPARILDAGCGTGHYCGRLAQDGFEALGIDLDPKMIAVAAARYPKARFLRLDMRDIGSLPGEFGAAFCIGNTASHLTRAELGGFLRDLAPRLRTQGRWILQVMNWDYILDRGGYTFRDRRLDERVVFERRYSDLSEERVRFSTRLISGGAPIFEGAVWLHPVRAEAYGRLHAAAGFRLVEHLGDFQGRAFDPGADTSNVLVFERAG